MKHQHTFAYDTASRAGHKALKHLKTGYETRKQNLPVTELTEILHLIHYEIFFSVGDCIVAEAMAKRLRAPSALTEDPNLVPSNSHQMPHQLPATLNSGRSHVL